MEETGILHHIESDGIDVHGLAMLPKNAKYMYIFAHGAGVGMYHAGMLNLAHALFEKGIATFRYHFPYKEKGKKAPGSPKEAAKTVKVIADYVKTTFPSHELFAGGKSYGGRMTSTAASQDMIPAVKGIIFFGFPLHRPGSPSNDRAEHLYSVKQPMLFISGTRDTLADLSFLNPVIEKSGSDACILDGADHSFNVLKSNPLTKAEILELVAEESLQWMNKHTNV